MLPATLAGVWLLEEGLERTTPPPNLSRSQESPFACEWQRIKGGGPFWEDTWQVCPLREAG